MNLAAENLCKTFADRVVLDRLSMSVEQGEAVAIVGPSGSGKSTLLNILGSLLTPDSGTVTLAGIRVDQLRGRELEAFRSNSVGLVFQEHLLLPHLTALENVLLPSLARREAAPVARARALLDRLGLGERSSDFPATLSGGERQRVALARALIHEPALVLADEPTGSLDQERAADLVGLLGAEAHEHARVVVMVTHNLDLANRLDRTLTLAGGRLVPEAT